MITKRIAWLIEQNLAKSDEILALTFTEKAAGEMEERVDRLLPYGYIELWISTFHAFCDRILRSHGLDIGLPTGYKLLDQTEQWLLVRKNLQKFHLDYYKPLGNPTKFIHALLNHFSRCKDEIVSPQEYLSYAQELRLNSDNAFTGLDIDTPEAKSQEISRINEIADAYHTYQNLLLENSALDFGDLITYTVRLLQTRPKLLELYRKNLNIFSLMSFRIPTMRSTCS